MHTRIGITAGAPVLSDDYRREYVGRMLVRFLKENWKEKQKMHQRRTLWTLVGTALVLMSMLLAACGPSQSSNTSGPIKNGGTVIDGLFEEPDTLLPLLTNETYAVIVDQSLWAPLWYGDNTGALHPGIADLPSAENGEISADLKTWTLKLHPDLKWSDGSPLTADDLEFSLKLYSNPDFANTFGFPTTAPGDPIGVASVTKVDNQTVKLVLRNGTPTILALLADGASSILPQKVFSATKPADIAKSPESFRPTVTSGPFKVTDRKQGASITVERNPNYYQAAQGLPHLDRVIYQIIPDQSTILTALQSHAISESWFLDVTKLDAYKAIQGYTTGFDQHPAGYELLVFNLATSTGHILEDLNVRKALSMSFNPQDLISQIYKGAAVRTCDDHGGTPYHEPDLTCYPFNVRQANALLDQSGWTGPKTAEGYRTKGGVVFELRYTTTTKATREQTQLLAQAAWKKNIGLKIDIINKPANVYFAAKTGILATGQFDIGEFASTLGYDPDDHTFFGSAYTPDKGGSNYMHYKNASVDQQEQIQQTTADVAKRKAAFHIIHQQILADLPVEYYYTAANIFCYDNNLKNYQPSALGPTEVWNIWEWRLVY